MAEKQKKTKVHVALIISECKSQTEREQDRTHYGRVPEEGPSFQRGSEHSGNILI